MSASSVQQLSNHSPGTVASIAATAQRSVHRCKREKVAATKPEQLFIQRFTWALDAWLGRITG
jgi:hypothetical protein